MSKSKTLGSMRQQIKATVNNAHEHTPYAIIEWRDLIAWGHIIDAHLATIQQNAEDSHAFQNFHRALCERFGYTHDLVDWRRDQVSLIECIAAQLEQNAEDAKRLRALERAMVNFMPPLKRQAVWGRAAEILREGEGL